MGKFSATFYCKLLHTLLLFMNIDIKPTWALRVMERESAREMALISLASSSGMPCEAMNLSSIESMLSFAA